jgi:anaphase-promoting complex subunit 3
VKTKTPNRRITRSQSGTTTTPTETRNGPLQDPPSKKITSNVISTRSKHTDSDEILYDRGEEETNIEGATPSAATKTTNGTRKKQKNCSQQQSQELSTLLESSNRMQRENEGIKSEKQKDFMRVLRGTIDVLNLLRLLGEAFRLLCLYRCEEAITAFKRLPTNHYNTPWVFSMLGRANFELVNYHESKALFQEVRKMEPFRTTNMEIYSTILWHLRQEVELSYLAHELLEYDREAPESWCAVGNCFSLQKEHETALKFFQRAIQLDPSFAYAFTLSGHEYIACDNWDKALQCFRNALRIDPRHYNAWYGLGIVYYRQEKYELAEYHFRRALSINEYNSVLHCYIGMTYHANRKSEAALNALQTALAIDSKNTLAKFKLASVLTTLGQYDKALIELEQLQEYSPKEASVYFLMGIIYRKMGKIHDAIAYLTLALDLDPKNSTVIKSTIEKLQNMGADGSTNNEDEDELILDLM